MVVLAGNAHPFEDLPFRVGNPFRLFGLSGCSLGGWRSSARTRLARHAPHVSAALDFTRWHCDFPSQDEKNLILGGNAAKLFDVE